MPLPSVRTDCLNATFLPMFVEIDRFHSPSGNFLVEKLQLGYRYERCREINQAQGNRRTSQQKNIRLTRTERLENEEC